MEPIDLTEKWLTPQDRADVRYKASGRIGFVEVAQDF